MQSLFLNLDAYCLFWFYPASFEALAVEEIYVFGFPLWVSCPEDSGPALSQSRGAGGVGANSPNKYGYLDKFHDEAAKSMRSPLVLYMR